MTDRKWVRGENGLWRSFDKTIQRQAGARRVAGIRRRLAALLARDGWVRKGRKWRKPA